MTQAKYAVFPLSLPVLLLASLTMVATEATLAGGSSDTIQTRGSRADNLWSLSRPRRISERSELEQDYSGDVSRMPGLFENLDAKTESKKDSNSAAQISSDNVENDMAVPFARNARSYSNFAPEGISRTEANENLDKRGSKFDRIEHPEILSFRQFSKRLAGIGQSETEDGGNVDRRAGKFGRMEQSLNVKADSNQDLDDDDADYDKRGFTLNDTLLVNDLSDNTNQSSGFMRFGRADSNSAARISPITTESEKSAPFLRNARSLSDSLYIRKSETENNKNVEDKRANKFNGIEHSLNSPSSHTSKHLARIGQSETEDDGNVDKRATGFVRSVESDLSEDLAEDARSLSNE